jgi:hypothetical protein
MSLEDKQRIIEGETAVTMLFTGQEPSAMALTKAPFLDTWTVRLDRHGYRRMLSLTGFRRSAVGDVSTTPGELLWLDRKERFAVTHVGLYKLGAREEEIGIVVPPMGDDR